MTELPEGTFYTVELTDSGKRLVEPTTDEDYARCQAAYHGRTRDVVLTTWVRSHPGAEPEVGARVVFNRRI